MYSEEIEGGKQTVSDREGEGYSLSSSTISLVYFIRFYWLTFMLVGHRLARILIGPLPRAPPSKTVCSRLINDVASTIVHRLRREEAKNLVKE